jgi:hypothetical protein
MSVNLQRRFSSARLRPRQLVIAGILVIALIAFELFNFDTTRFALENLLGGVTFLGIAWAVILAIAFCGIDLAGLVRLFSPQQGKEQPKEVWYLMGAWLLGATMNAVMTWWAVSLTLLDHNLGNEVLSREQLIRFVPIFVAILVWLTRILFIGSLSMAGGHIFGQGGGGKLVSAGTTSSSQNISREHRPPVAKVNQTPVRQPTQATPSPARQSAPASRPAPAPAPAATPVGAPATRNPAVPPKPSAIPAAPVSRQPVPDPTRVKQRPPRPGMSPSSLNASSRTPRS